VRGLAVIEISREKAPITIRLAPLTIHPTKFLIVPSA
jgi:hypothetical protein